MKTCFAIADGSESASIDWTRFAELAAFFVKIPSCFPAPPFAAEAPLPLALPDDNPVSCRVIASASITFVARGTRRVTSLANAGDILAAAVISFNTHLTRRGDDDANAACKCLARALITVLANVVACDSSAANAMIAPARSATREAARPALFFPSASQTAVTSFASGDVRK